MSVKGILKNLDFSVEKEELAYLKSEASKFEEVLKKWILRKKIDADVFFGGSFAKGTLVKGDFYDVDIFIRFDWREENISDILEEVVREATKEIELGFTRVHGSRDYFRVERSEKLTFEIIPVSRIKKVQASRNVTDLSYFHVRYVKKKINKKLASEIAFAKIFCKAHEVYGAETYIQGFSGYGLEN